MRGELIVDCVWCQPKPVEEDVIALEDLFGDAPSTSQTTSAPGYQGMPQATMPMGAMSQMGQQMQQPMMGQQMGMMGQQMGQQMPSNMVQQQLSQQQMMQQQMMQQQMMQQQYMMQQRQQQHMAMQVTHSAATIVCLA